MQRLWTLACPRAKRFGVRALIASALILLTADALAMGERPRRSRYSAIIAIGATVPLPRLPDVRGPEGRPLVVIDPGHGGHDPGAISPFGGAREKEVTLAIARALRDRLLQGGRVRVALTRGDDRFIVLAERYGVARRLRADLFVSVHADSAGDDRASGASIYTLSETASDREAEAFAARENRADVLNGVNLGGQDDAVGAILLDLAQRETMAQSDRFAAVLRREGGDLIPFRGAYRQSAGLIVLKSPETPSVLFEAGYLSNEEDVAFLISREGRRRIAEGAARAIEVFLARAAVESQSPP